ncbi:MAG TPA: glycosyl hydrolase family 53 [Eubacterium sp.]|nr:glycosyl hydrolase family 53 [Eubacterium sp.]
MQVGESSADDLKPETENPESEGESTTQFPVIERKTADEIKINPEKIDVTTFSLPDVPEESGIFVQPIEDISDDFIRGMDASAVLAVENSGAKYYGFGGEEQDVFKTLAEAGVNYIRLRVWNDPYDENGNGYGGGNNDVATAIELGKRATQYGMKVCIDFHYSDFWADPTKQYVPKAWKGMNLEQKSDALYDFTVTSLTDILNAGVDVCMVQVGNEINKGMSGETFVSSVAELLKAGSSAVREVSKAAGKDIQVAVHYTDIDKQGEVAKITADLDKYGVDYDIFAMSYYSFWHGSMENMQDMAEYVQDTYGKKVVIAETSYCYTTEDGDGSGNSVSGDGDLVDGYDATVQGQADMLRDICAAADEADIMGVFYWEGTWIPVGPADADNSSIWEKYGSGWASSYSGSYDPKDAGKYYGGCSWDNQAMFDFTGHPLDSLKVFRELKYGATAPLAVEKVPDVEVSCNVGAELALPETAQVVYNDKTANREVSVVWDAEQTAAIDTNIGGSYKVEGILQDEELDEEYRTVVANVEVKLINYVVNSGFEDSDTSMWKVTYNGKENPTDYQVNAKDARTGETAFHFWSASEMDFSIEQEVTGLEPGTYQLSAFSQGGDMLSSSVLELYAIADGQEYTQQFELTGYADWKEPAVTDIKLTGDTIVVGVRMKCNGGSWGTVDDFTLNRVGE